jgi:xanthine/uracil permease
MEPKGDDIGWARAVATGVVVLVVGLGVAVVGSDQLIKRIDGISRENVEYLVSAYFVACVVAAAWVLRRLQRRGVL